MLTLLQTSQLLAYRAAWMSESGNREAGALASCAKVFCAESAEKIASEALQILPGPRNYARLLKEMARCGRPLVTRINGPCVAGGMGLMLSCDIVIARDDTYFQTPEVNVGIFPMMVGAFLYRNLPQKRVAEMVLTGRKISVPKAAQMGMITRAAAPQALDVEIQNTLKALTAKSPLTARIGKEAFRIMSDMAFEPAVDYLCEALGRVISTRDTAEEKSAFLEKCSPRFTGR